MKWIITGKKALASSVNVALVFSATSPFYYFFGMDVWRGVCIALFFGYNLALSDRCLGQRVAHTYQNEPTNVAYAALYTASTATLLWWIWLPLDLALANGLFLQIPCLLIFGNTPHGLLTGRKTLTEYEHLFESIYMLGQCPDCNAVKLERSGAYVACKACHGFFYAENFVVRRLEAPPNFFKCYGEVVPFKSAI